MKTLNPLYRFVSLIAILCWEIKAALYAAITFAWEAIICSISGTTVVCRQATMSLCISLIVYHANDGTQAALPSSNSSEPQTADPNPSCSHETPRRPQLSCRDRLRGTASSRAIGLLRTAPNSSALTLLISPHLQVQPFWVSALFSQAATFLNLARCLRKLLSIWKSVRVKWYFRSGVEIGRVTFIWMMQGSKMQGNL